MSTLYSTVQYGVLCIAVLKNRLQSSTLRYSAHRSGLFRGVVHTIKSDTAECMTWHFLLYLDYLRKIETKYNVSACLSAKGGHVGCKHTHYTVILSLYIATFVFVSFAIFLYIVETRSRNMYCIILYSIRFVQGIYTRGFFHNSVNALKLFLFVLLLNRD